MANTTDSENIPITLEIVTAWARSNREWKKVCEYLSKNLKDLFAVCANRRWPIAHQIVYHNKTDVLEQILTFYSDDNIDITTKSGDNRTLLTVATEKQTAHPKMFQYVSRLFKQNELITAAKTSNWQLVRDLLKENKDLANEKPPYSSYFLIHYIIQNGDVKILQELMGQYQFTLTVRNKNNETPLEMASRLGKHEICKILRPPQDHSESKAELIQKQPVVKSSNPAPSTIPKPIARKNPIGFEALVDQLNPTTEQTVLINSAHPALRQTPGQQKPPERVSQTSCDENSAINTAQPLSPNSLNHQPRRTKKTIVTEVPFTETEPLSPPTLQSTGTLPLSTTDILSMRLTCPLTKKLFVSPVVADDGHTYEQAAIVDWVKKHKKSPSTDKHMTNEFRDNNVIKSLVKLLQTQV